MVIFNSYVTNYQRVIVVGDEKGKGTHMLLVGALELFGAIEFCDFPKKKWSFDHWGWVKLPLFQLPYDWGYWGNQHPAIPAILGT